VLNEVSVRGEGAVIKDDQCAAYIHVDDGVFVSARRRGPDDLPWSDVWMMRFANRAEENGLLVPDRKLSGSVQKVLGYEPELKPARYRMAGDRRALLYEALRYFARCSWIWTRDLQGVLGVWVWGALLNRPLLSIPHAVFHFVDILEPGWRCVWPSVRAELNTMADCLVGLVADVGAPMLPIVGATDAEGANQDDYGGFGVVAAVASQEELEACVRSGVAPGFAVAKLDGLVPSIRRPLRPLRRTTPYSKLPRSLLQADPERWISIALGRWKWHDHITLGEGRACLHFFELLSRIFQAHRHRVFSLEDNLSWLYAFTKGRSTSPGLNYLLRRRCSISLATGFVISLPWTDTAHMPADGDSRRKPQLPSTHGSY